MKNDKMVNAAKSFDTVAGVCEKIIGAVAVVCVVVAVLLLIFGSKMYDISTVSLDLDFLKISLAEGYLLDEKLMKLYMMIALLTVGAMCFAISRGIVLFRQILAPMKEGRPFEPTVADNMKKIAWITLIVGAVTQVAGIVEQVILTKAFPMEEILSSSAIGNVEYSFLMDFNFVIIFCAIMFLSYIFAYGQALQKESDETL